MKDTLENVASGKSKLFFSSDDAKAFGFLLKCDKDTAYIQRALYGKTDRDHTSSLLNEDRVQVAEAGEDFSAFGFSNSWHWLQNQ